MSHLKKLDPIKALKGRLNHLKNTDQPVIFLTYLSNILGKSPKETSSLNKYSIDDINKLKSKGRCSTDSVNKLSFVINVQKSVGRTKKETTIYEPLQSHHKRIVSELLYNIDQLNSRQILYLQYVLRKKLSVIYPHWENLHFNPDSPYLRDFLIMPLLKNVQNLYELKTV